ncbi:MAG: UTRA domain-containing protein [Rhodospirillales bacterium]
MIDPVLAPGYLQQDFSVITPAQYLNGIAPVQEVEHVVQAVTQDGAIAKHLSLAPGEPCLLVTRRTWSAGRLAALTKLYYPGSRFRLTGRFIPAGVQWPPAAQR